MLVAVASSQPPFPLLPPLPSLFTVHCRTIFEVFEIWASYPKTECQAHCAEGELVNLETGKIICLFGNESEFCDPSVLKGHRLSVK